MNTDWFPKYWPQKVQASGEGRGGGVQWHVSLRYFLDFNSLKSPFLGFLVIQTGYWPDPFSLDGALQNGGLLLLFLMPGNYPGYQRFFTRAGGIFSVGRRPTHLGCRPKPREGHYI